MLSSQRKLLWIIFAQALVATLGSLYYSTFGDPVENIIRGNLFNTLYALEPCTLCWYARILMYPITVLSFVGLLKRDRNVVDYILALSIPGIFLETYHYAIQRFVLPISLGCTANNPCTALQVNYFGFITIPFLCLVAFIVITSCALYIKRIDKKGLQ